MARELDALALLYTRQAKHDLAEPLHRRAMSIRRATATPRGASHPGVLSPGGALGQLARGAEPLKRRALQLEELIMGPDSPDLARTLNEIGVLYYLQSNIQ